MDREEKLVIAGDLLSMVNTYICHQCNCTSTTGRGLAVDIFNKYPSANVYKQKHKLGDYSAVGTIDVFDADDNHVINMYAQYRPAGIESGGATRAFRKQWFKECLDDLHEYLVENARDHATVAFPYLIGCGLAGGNWSEYHALILDFAENISDVAKVVIVRRE
jgi:O-acetyl-ADP-ribose deacetylase (regulator of RNase III)